MECSASTDTLSLSLRAWPEYNVNASSLSSIIPRISQQRGHIRNITEEGLLEEIKAAETDDHTANVGEPQEGVTRVDHTPSRMDEVLRARQEIVKQIEAASHEAYRALDFISLLLSKDTPRTAEISLSQGTQLLVPLGSLGADKIPAPQLPLEGQRDQDLISRGWKLQGLENTAESLLRSADRLEKEVESECKYWTQILAVRDKGWSVCRLPRERHTLGVRFGFGEAAAGFKERGLAALRRGEDGGITLDQGIVSSQIKTVRVRMRRSNAITGTSTAPEQPKPEDSASIENLILQARNSVYEEELFYELSREARQLANQGVRTVDDTIVLSLGDTTQILIDLIPVGEATSTNSEQSQPLCDTSDDDVAQGIALALRILLSYAHRLNLKRRSQLPPPIDRKRPIPPHFILHPILVHLLHQQALRALTSLLESLVAPAVAAGLHASYSLSTYTNCTSPVKPPTAIATQMTWKTAVSTPADTVVDRFKDRLESIAAIHFPGNQKLTLEVYTALYLPLLGTEYIITTKPNQSTAPPTQPNTEGTNDKTQPQPLLPPMVRFNSLNETTLYLAWTLSRSIVEEIRLFTPPPPPVTESATPTSLPGEVGWEPLGDQRGMTTELQKSFPQRAHIRRMKVEVVPDKLTLRWGETNGKGGGKVYVWEGALVGGEGQKETLVGVVRGAGEFPATSVSARQEEMSSSPAR
ncbi:MAG: RNA polymerase II mediator complex subunit [Geoglossum simile]|nr:MAG: RNA polymerase II mediator complex subunit [Geoglossum simile]